MVGRWFGWVSTMGNEWLEGLSYVKALAIVINHTDNASE